MGLLDVINWRDAASAACDCWAGVLGDQAVNAVGQNPGLTARNQAHGVLTASNQSLDHTRGDAHAPAIPACGIHWRAVWNFVSPSKELSSTISIRDLRVARSQNEMEQPHSLRGGMKGASHEWR